MLADFLSKKMPRRPLARLGAAFFNCLASNWREDWDNLRLIVPIEHYPELLPGNMVGHREQSSSSVDFVHVGTATDAKYDLEYNENDTVTVFKCRLLGASGVAVDQQLLTFGGKLLQEGRTLQDYGIQPGSIVQLTVRPRGGTTSPATTTYAPALVEDQALTLAQKEWMNLYMPTDGPWAQNALLMVHFLGTPAYSVPYQQASETERRLVLHFYASQGHQVPRPPSSFSGLADQVAQQVTTSMGITTARGTDELETNPHFSSVEEALASTSSSNPPLACTATDTGKGGSTASPYDTMAAYSSTGPPSYEQATSLEGLRVFLQGAVNSGAAPFQTIDMADAYESSSIQTEEDYQECVHLEDDDVCDSESSGEWHLPGISELNELEDQRALERTRLASMRQVESNETETAPSVFDFAMWSDFINHNWIQDEQDFEHKEGKLGPD